MDTNAITNQPIYIEWVAPTNGSIVSNVVTLQVNVATFKAPLQRIEWERDGIPFKTNYYNTNWSPTKVMIVSPLLTTPISIKK